MFKHQFKSKPPINIVYRPKAAALDTSLPILNENFLDKESNHPKLKKLISQKNIDDFTQNLSLELCRDLGSVFETAYHFSKNDNSEVCDLRFIDPILALLEKEYLNSYDASNRNDLYDYSDSELKFNETITQAYLEGNTEFANRVVGIITQNQPWDMACTLDFLALCAQNNKPQLVQAVANFLCKDEATIKKVCKKLESVSLKPSYYQIYVSYCELAGWMNYPKAIKSMSYSFLRAAHKIDGLAQSECSVLSFLKGLNVGEGKLALLLSHHKEDFTKARWEQLISSKQFKENEDLVAPWHLASYADCLADKARTYVRG